MSDIIKLLPDSVANQIAAGEVIQRPSSVVKELAENAVDSGATEISVVLRDSGRTLVQVIDNGSGMSETDARLAFERHATSKISSADDLFTITTKGFRGEALASVAAVSMTELRTRREEDEAGTLIEINNSRVIRQEPCSCAAGSVFSVKNLFYNVPARRKFLKSDNTEFRHIITEFQRVALAHPEIKFTLIHNDQEIYRLPSGNHRQRIVALFGKHYNQNLVTVETNTTIVSISGFAGKPENARRSAGEQFFFVNNRFIRHPYLHRAVLEAYQGILPPDTVPAYFIYMTADPSAIDVNIHPTKTEIKFEDERSVWQIMLASLREALGRFNVVPSLDVRARGGSGDTGLPGQRARTAAAADRGRPVVQPVRRIRLPAPGDEMAGRRRTRHTPRLGVALHHHRPQRTGGGQRQHFSATPLLPGKEQVHHVPCHLGHHDDRPAEGP